MLNGVFKTVVQFVVFMAVGCVVLVTAYLMGNSGIDEHVVKSAAMFFGLVPLSFGLAVVAEQVRITYARPKDIVYPSVEAFPDREPT